MRLRNLDAEGIVRVGAEVRTGDDLLVGKRKSQPQTESQQFRFLFEDSVIAINLWRKLAKDIK